MTEVTLPQNAAMGDLLRGAANRFGSRIALVHGSLAASFAALAEQADGVAHALIARGVRPGDVVALRLPNSIDFVLAYHGALLAGAAVCPINPVLPPKAIDAIVERAGASVVVAEPVPPASRPAAGELPAVSPDDVAHLASTGGTTGTPKLVRVLHRNLVGNLAQMLACRANASLRTRADGSVEAKAAAAEPRLRGVGLGTETALAAAPFFHAHGLVTLNFFLVSGTTSVVIPRFDAAGYLDLIERRRATYLTGSPALWRAVLAAADDRGRDLTSVTYIGSGAAPADPQMVTALEALFPNAAFTESYGLTEATCLLTTCYPGADPPPGSVGRPIPGTTIEIRSLDNPGQPSPPGTAGEVWACGPQITAGYLGEAEETGDQFQDGWLRTGDVGMLDEAGYLVLVDRIKDVVLYKGYNVYPRQLEEILAEHPGVRQAVVIGRPDPDAGEIPVGYVVAASQPAPSAEELMAHVAARVAPYQRLRDVRFTDAIPVSPAGKVLKAELRLRDQANLSSATTPEDVANA